MKTAKTPPDHLLRAYAEMINAAFLTIRSNAFTTDENEMERMHDLADAMHNVGAIIADYDEWIGDQKFRELYLQPFDGKWGGRGLRLEEFLKIERE